MSDQRETYQRFSVPEAARHYGVSVATVRRRIRDGSYLAERVERPQGAAYVVLVPTDQATDHETLPSDQQVGTTARLNRSADDQAAAIATVIQAAIREAITPLVEMVDRHEHVIRTQAETIGTLRAELAAARAPESPTEARTEPAPAETPTDAPGRFHALWVRLWPVLAIVAVALALAGVLLFWPR